MCIYFFPFCQRKKITVLPALFITEISTCRRNYKSPKEGISFAGNASVGKNQKRRCIHQALGSSQSWTPLSGADLLARGTRLQTHPLGQAVGGGEAEAF